jgi:hypothetical protein
MTSPKAPAIGEQLMTEDATALLGARCRGCGELSFPVRLFCALCGERDPQPEALATLGTVYSYTVVHFAPPGYLDAVPYAVGIVELPERIRVTATLIANPLTRLKIGAAVRFRPVRVRTDDDEQLSFAYSLENA